MNDKCYLGIETKPNNYFPINLTDLKLFNVNPTSLSELDSLTGKYTTEEIKNSIKEANLLEIDDFMPLIVIYYEKDKARKMKPLTKDYKFNMWQDINDNFDNKEYLNLIYNFLSNKIDEAKLKILKSFDNASKFLEGISHLDYIVIRKLYFYLYERI